MTLIFGLERYAAVVEAYLRGLERLVEAGGDPGSVLSVASFFVSRVDTEADRRLDEVGRPELEGKLAIANAKLAYRHWQEAFSGDRWAALAAAGRLVRSGVSGLRPRRRTPPTATCSTSRSSSARTTVNTMPAETIAAFQDHGEVRGATLTEGVEEAHALLDELAGAGVDYDDVVETLEREGVQKFSDSFAELLEGIETKLRAVAAR